jgi:hypothetical protein
MASNPARRQGGLTKEARDGVVIDSMIRLNANKYAGGDVAKFAELVKSRPDAFSNPDAMISRMSQYVDNGPPSYLYKADLPDHSISRMIDLENPVPGAIAEPLSKAAMDQFGSGLTRTSGEHLLKEVEFNFKSAGHPSPKAAAAEWLSGQGVPGLKFLDAGSRGVGGSSNYVVFPGNEDILKILERNGMPLPPLIGPGR